MKNDNEKLNCAVVAAMACVLVACNAATRAAEAVAQGLAANTWVRVTPKYVPTPNNGKHTPASWNQLTYDPVGKRLICMDRWSDDLRGIAIYANGVLAYDAPSNTVTCLKLGNWKTQATGPIGTVPLPENEKDPTPVDRHPYGCVAVVPDQNALYLSSGANQNIGGHPNDTWKFDIAAAQWSKVKSDKQPLFQWDLDDCMAYDPVNKVIVRSCLGEATWLLDVTTGQWRDAGCKVNSKIGMGAAMCYDSKRGRMLLAGGPGAKRENWNSPSVELWSYAVKENKWKRLADAPAPTFAPGLAYDSRHDVLMLHGSTHGRGSEPGNTYLYFPEKDQWLKLDTPSGAAVPNAAYHCLAYDEANDVFVRMTAEDMLHPADWWMFRLDPASLPRDGSK